MPQPELISLFVAPLNRLGLTYMVTGAVAAIVYGEPRLTNDIDIVIELGAPDVEPMRAAFPHPQFYVPPAQVMNEELRRARHGHFNVIHIPTSLKADFYPVAGDPLHEWALSRRRHMAVGTEIIAFAPPEYVVLRKLEYSRAAGGSDRHRRDIRAILRTQGDDLDRGALLAHIDQLDLETEWRSIAESGS